MTLFYRWCPQIEARFPSCPQKLKLTCPHPPLTLPPRTSPSPSYSSPTPRSPLLSSPRLPHPCLHPASRSSRPRCVLAGTPVRRENLFCPEFQAKRSLPYSLKGSSLTNFFPDVSFDQQSMRPGPAFPQQVSELPGMPLPRGRTCTVQAAQGIDPTTPNRLGTPLPRFQMCSAAEGAPNLP